LAKKKSDRPIAVFHTTLRDRATRGYGERLLETIKRLFHVWHQRDGMRSDRWKDSAVVPEYQQSPHRLSLSSHRFTAVITAKHPS